MGTLELAKLETEEQLAELKKLLDGGEKVSEAQMAEVEALLKNAELEVRAAPLSAQEKEANKSWVKQMKGKLDDLKKSALLGNIGGGAKQDGPEKTVRARQQQVTNRMESQSSSLETARRTMQETEQTATGIMLGLAEQRQTIKSTSKKLEDVNGNLGYADQLLTSMKSWWKFGSIQDKTGSK